MNNQTVIPIHVDFSVNVNHAYPRKNLSEFTQKRIEELWKKEIIRTQGRVFNGQLLSGHQWSENKLEGHFVEYKHYIAQARDPSLFEELKIYPICVCGYTIANDHILIGKRSPFVTDYQNCFELVPAGGIDNASIEKNHVNFLKQLQIELQEEAGIESSMIKRVTPAFLVLYPETHSYEICIKIELDPKARNTMGERDEEYTELIWIPKSELKQFTTANLSKFIPLSLQIMNFFH